MTTNSNPLGMSDEEFLNNPTPVQESTDDEPNDDEDRGIASLDSSTEAADAALSDSESEEAEDTSDDADTEEQADEPEDESEEDDAEEASSTEETSEPETSNTETESGTDYKSFVEKVTSKFKANGREMQVDSPDDVVQLMQMGANYAKKMAALKPSLKILKVLEKNELLDDSKIGFLIDLHNKNPAAIKKLLKDSNIDPVDIDVDEDSNYQPTRHEVSDQEMKLDEVLEDIKDSPTYTKTLDVVSSQWDDASRQIIATTPQILKVLNEHISNGVFDKVWTEVERERTLGRLSDMSDFDAYRTIGDKIFGQGESANSPQSKQVVTRKKVDEIDASRNRKKQAASPSRNKTSSSKGPSYNPLAMSDEEFMKSFDSKFA